MKNETDANPKHDLQSCLEVQISKEKCEAQKAARPIKMGIDIMKCCGYKADLRSVPSSEWTQRVSLLSTAKVYVRHSPSAWCKNDFQKMWKITPARGRQLAQAESSERGTWDMHIVLLPTAFMRD